MAARGPGALGRPEAGYAKRRTARWIAHGRPTAPKPTSTHVDSALAPHDPEFEVRSAFLHLLRHSRAVQWACELDRTLSKPTVDRDHEADAPA